MKKYMIATMLFVGCPLQGMHKFTKFDRFLKTKVFLQQKKEYRRTPLLQQDPLSEMTFGYEISQEKHEREAREQRAKSIIMKKILDNLDIMASELAIMKMDQMHESFEVAFSQSFEKALGAQKEIRSLLKRLENKI